MLPCHKRAHSVRVQVFKQAHLLQRNTQGMSDDSNGGLKRTPKQQFRSSRWSWSALLIAGLALGVAVHHGSASLHSWQWEELGHVKPLLWLPFSFTQTSRANATSCLVQVSSPVEGCSAFSLRLMIVTALPPTSKQFRLESTNLPWVVSDGPF